MSIKSFDVDQILKHRDQLWAEAVVREQQGESIRLPEYLWQEATHHQEKRREIDPWESVIRSLLVNMEPSSDGRRRVVTDEIWNALAITVERRDRSGALRISEIMQRLGFKRTTVRGQSGEVQAGYVTDLVHRLELYDEGLDR